MARTDWLYNDIVTETDMNHLGQEINENTEAMIEDQITTLPLSHGTQTITAPRTGPARVKIPGRTLVNQSGKAGRFANNAAGWVYANVAGFDVDGEVGIIHANAQYGQIRYSIPSIIAGHKYYIAAVLRTNLGSAENYLALVTNPGGTGILSPFTGTGNFELVSTIGNMPMSGLTDPVVTIFDSKTSGWVQIHIKKIRVYDLTAMGLESATKSWCDANLPYVDSLQHLTGAYVKSVGKNLLPPFNEWMSLVNNTIKRPYSLEITAQTAWAGREITIPALPNTQYAMACDMNGTATNNSISITLQSVDSDGNLFPLLIIYRGGAAQTATTPSDCVGLRVIVTNGGETSAGTFTFTNPMLNVGNTAIPFVEQQESHLYLIDSLGEGEVFEDGQKNKVWERKMLDGTIPWNFGAHRTNCKLIYTSPFVVAPGLSLGDRGISKIVKYNGKILPAISGTSESLIIADCFQLNPDGTLHMTVANADSGWGTDYVPTPDEIKAYILGWAMYNGADGGSGSLYNGTGFKAWAKIYCGVGTPAPTWVTGMIAVLGSQVGVCPTVMNDMGYTPNELHYKLVTPVTVPVQTEGSLVLSAGPNQVTLDEGVVVREVVIPGYRSDLDAYELNGNGVFGGVTHSEFLFRTERILDIYKDGVDDKSNWVLSTDAASYGKERLWARVTSDVDPSVVYTVTYLAESYQFTAPALSAELTYAENLGTVAQKTAEKVSMVETDLSEYKSYQSSRVVMVEKTLSRPNRLINGRFKINQRGQSNYTTGLTLDGWRLDPNSGGVSLSVQNDFVRLNQTNNGGTNAQSVYQRLENPQDYSGKIYTLTVCYRTNQVSQMLVYADGVVIESSRKILRTSPSWTTDSITVKMPQSTSNLAIFLYADITGALGYTDFSFCKFEEGDVPTSFIPLLPGEDLALCQRYYLQFGEWCGLSRALLALPNELWFFIPLPVTMRIAPSLVGAINTDWLIARIDNVPQSGFNVGIIHNVKNGIWIQFTKTAHGLTDAMLSASNIAALSAEIY